jgi:uncharacterized membrane protein YkvA (DUF1232 family)
MSSKPTPVGVVVLAIVFSVIYLVNPTAGVFEFIPDNIPLIGNLDEAGATAMLIWAINELRGRRAPAPSMKDVSPPFDQ